MTAKFKKESDSGHKSKEPLISEHEELREIKASKILRKYMLWSMGSGLIPFPLVDTAVLSGIQLKLLLKLSKFYEVPFSKNVGKSVIATLLGFTSANSLRGSILTRYIKTIPGLGFWGMVSMPIYSGAVTYAIGKVFIQHFESGGTLLTFKPHKVKKYFAKLYKEGQQAASDLKTGTN